MNGKSLFEAFPELLHEWSSKNTISPDVITPFSHQQYWWKCHTCGFEWKAAPASRSAGAGCPACSGRIAIEGKNDLQSQVPEIAAEWDYSKNGSLLPSQVTSHSNKMVWWKCKMCGQSWEARIAGRTTNHRGCPICAGRKVIPGVNDLASVNPTLSDEWDNEKNNLSPSEITASSGKKAWWKCKICGFGWAAQIASRNSGAGCPRCAKSLQTSFPEQALYYYFHRCFPDTVNGYHPSWIDTRSEIDVFIPSHSIGIEYDGLRWHANVEKDRKKDLAARSNGVFLIRLRELGLPSLNETSYCINVDAKDKSYSSLKNAIDISAKIIAEKTGVHFCLDVDLDRDYNQIRSCFSKAIIENSLQHKSPSFLTEWDNEKNQPLTPAQVTIGSDTKVWWTCSKCGYGWKAAVGDRSRGVGCPNCAGKIVLSGINDLQSNSDSLSKEWLYEKNGTTITPQKVAVKSNRRVWWKCSRCGYEWQARISDRYLGSGCPACSGRVAVPGKTDLATINPALAKEWDYSKNVDCLNPSNITSNSNKKAWWICSECGCSWQAAVYSRNSGRGCPECAKRKRQNKTVRSD